jgi:hypothetical protein
MPPARVVDPPKPCNILEIRLTFCQDLALICVPMNSGLGQMRGKGVAMVAKAGTGVGKQQE